ncbi:MAG: glycosyltransferase [Solirubrobacterales bacterium]|nr:glycosyltransferase [Solirubrobacterales bacterium]
MPAAAPAHLDALHDLDVVLPVRREAPWLLATHAAALATALPRRWHGGAIVVCDGARPATARAAHDALAAHHAVAHRTLLRVPRGIGAAGAADLGLAEATGELVALFDARTRPEPHALELLVTALDADEGTLWAAPPAPGAAVVRREAFLALGAFDPRLPARDAIRDAADRARREGWRLAVVPEAAFRVTAGARRAGPRFARRPPGRWDGASLERWLLAHRRHAVREDVA